MTALIRSSNWPRYFVPGDHQREIERDHFLVAQQFRHVAARRFPARALPTIAVLPTPASPNNTGLFFVRRQSTWMTRSISLCRPMTGSSSLFFASSVRSRPKARSAGVLTSFFETARRSRRFLLAFRRSEIRIEFLQDFVARPLDIDFETLEHPRGDAFAFAQQAEQNVLGADVGMIERLRFLAGERENFFHPRRVGNVADHLRLRTGADLFLDFHPDGFEIEPHLLEDVHRDALPELDQAEQKMLGADVIVVEAVGFFASQRQDLLGARSKIIHCCYGSEVEPFVRLPRHFTNIRFGKDFQTLADDLGAQEGRVPRR